MLRLIFLCLLFTVAFAQNEGDPCVQQKDNAPGVCKILKDCPEGLAALMKQELPQICGFSGTVPIVCCPGTIATKVQRKVGDISLEKCKEYSKVVIKRISIPTFSIGPPAKVNDSACTHIVRPLVIGGENAIPKEFPHMALLGYGSPNDKKWACGGSLLSERFVLTAGHCLSYGQHGKVRYIRLGDLNIAKTTDDARPEEFLIDEIIAHPDYKPPSKYNDIALLKMNRAVTFSLYIRPACLYFGQSELPKTYIATGWGLTDAGDSKGADHLQKVIINSFTHAECNETYESNISNRKLKYGIIPETQLCAGGRYEEKDTCQGDSGGPLQIYSKHVHCSYDVIGVTSFGKTCGLVSIPGVYTRVQHYVPWIESVVWPQ